MVLDCIKSVPDCLQSFVRVLRRCKTVKQNNSEGNLKETATAPNSSISPRSGYHKCETTDQNEHSGAANITWKMVVDVFDGIMFCIQLGVIIIVNLFIALILNTT